MRNEPDSPMSGNRSLVAAAYLAAEDVRMLWETTHYYARSVDPLEMSEILSLLDSIIRNTLDGLGWKDLACKLPDALTVDRAYISEVEEIAQRAFGLQPCGHATAQSSAETPLDPGLLTAMQRLHTVMCTCCLQPDPEADAAFRMPARHVFMLRKYWYLLWDILQTTGSSPVYYTPHPLTPIIINTETRIQRCLDALKDEQVAEIRGQVRRLTDSLLEPEGYAVEWNEGDAAALGAAITTAIERAWLRFSSSGFDLTAAERFHLANARQALDEHRVRLDSGMKGILGSVTQPLFTGQETNREKPKDEVWGYVRDVEISLRRLVFTAYRERFGAAWLHEVKKAVGEAAVTDTLARLAKEKSDECDFLHFLQPSVLRQLCTHNWNVTGHLFPGKKRKDINAMLEEWLSARTRNAHHRPEHIWPKIERDRARVACHDLLESMEQSVRAETGE